MTEEELEESPEVEVLVKGITHSTSCEHQWVRTNDDPNSDLESYQCFHCWSGASYSKDSGEPGA